MFKLYKCLDDIKFLFIVKYIYERQETMTMRNFMEFQLETELYDESSENET